MPLGFFRLLLIRGYLVVLIHCDNRCSLLFCKILFFMAHHAGCILFLRKANKTLQGEVQYIIPGHDYAILGKMKSINGELDVFYRTKTSLIGGRAIIENCDLVRVVFSPILKVMCKLVIANHNELVNQWGDIVYKPIKDRLFSNLE